MTIKFYKKKISKVARLCDNTVLFYNADHFDAQFREDYNPQEIQGIRAWLKTDLAQSLISHWLDHHKLERKSVILTPDPIEDINALPDEQPLWIGRGVLLVFAFFALPKAKATYLSRKLLTLGDVMFSSAQEYSCPIFYPRNTTEHMEVLGTYLIHSLNNALNRYSKETNSPKSEDPKHTIYADVYRLLAQGLLCGHSPTDIAEHILNDRFEFCKSSTLFRKYATDSVLELLSLMEVEVVFLIERTINWNIDWFDSHQYLLRQIELDIIPKYKNRIFVGREPFVVIATREFKKKDMQFQLVLWRDGTLTPQLVRYDK